MDRNWMYGVNRVSQEYINGVFAFKRAAEQDMLKKGIKFMYCPTCIPFFETPSNQVRFDLRRVVKHLQITAINAWTVHKFYPLVQHILLGGSFKSKHAINVLSMH